MPYHTQKSSHALVERFKKSFMSINNCLWSEKLSGWARLRSNDYVEEILSGIGVEKSFCGSLSMGIKI